MTADQQAVRGLFRKFVVERADGRDQPGGDKADARYFVLDYWHDPHARKALSAYAEAVHAECPEFAADLRRRLLDTDVAAAPWRPVDESGSR